MKKFVILCAFAALICSPATAMTVSEDFTTSVYKDPAGTNADWDTAAAELRLPSTRSKLFDGESASDMIPLNREAGWRFRVSVPGAIIGLGRYLPASDMDTYTLNLWSDAGAHLATALVSGATGWAWADIEPVQLSTSSFYRVSVVLSSAAVFSLSVPYENDYIKLSSACVSSGAEGFPDILTDDIVGLPDILFRSNFQTHAYGRSTGYDSGTSRARYLSYSAEHELSSGTINYEFSFSSTSVIWFGWQTNINDYVSHRYVRWRAELTSPDGVSSPIVSSITIHSNSFPEPPLSSSPPEGFHINYTTPTLSWQEAYDPDSDAILYRLQLADNDSFLSPLIDSAGLNVLASPSSGLSQGIWYWRLKAKDDYNDESAWSATYSFTVDLSPPAQIADLAAAAGSANGEIDLVWQAPSDTPFDSLASYDIFYATFSFSEADISLMDSVSGPSPQAPGSSENFTLSGLQDNMEYFFAVRTRDEAGNVSTLSNIASSLTNSSPSVSIISPSGGALLSGNSDIVWNVSDPNPDDIFHDIDIFLSKDGGLTYELLHDLSDVSADRWTWNTFLSGNGAYFRLKISATDSRGLRGTSAETENFSIDNDNRSPVITVQSPQEGDIKTGQVLIGWNFSDPDSYDRLYFNVYIASSSSAGFQILEEKLYFGMGLRTGSTSYLLDSSLYPDGGEYEIKVEASDGLLSAYSLSGQFSIWNVNNDPNPFSLLLPTDGATLSTLLPAFSWEDKGDPDIASGDSISYRFFLYSSTSPETLVLEISPLSLNSYTISDTSILSDLTTYFWRVKAEDTQGGERLSAETFSFYVKWSEVICGPLSVSSPNMPLHTYIEASEASDILTLQADDGAASSPIMLIPGGSSYKIVLKHSSNGLEAQSSAYTFNLAFSYDGLDVISPSTTKLFVLDEAERRWTLVDGQETDTASRQVTAEVQGLSYFRLLNYAAPSSGSADLKNYPNPFNPLIENTEIVCVLSGDAALEFEIYSVFGDLVRKFSATGQGNSTGVANTFIWDGRNGAGDVAANGVYVLRLIVKPVDGGEFKRRRLIGVLK